MQSPTTLVSVLDTHMLVEDVEQIYPFGQLVAVPVGRPPMHTWNSVCDTQAKLDVTEQALQAAQAKSDDSESKSSRTTVDTH